jgi:hypothetical protein
MRPDPVLSAIGHHFERDWGRVEVNHDLLSQEVVVTLRVGSEALMGALDTERCRLASVARTVEKQLAKRDGMRRYGRRCR